MGEERGSDYYEWRFGLSEYDPYNPRTLPGYGERMFQETLDVVETLIQQTLAMRRIAPLPEVEKSAQRLHNVFAYFLTYLPPTSQLEPRFLSLYTQEQSVRGLMYFENKRYKEALETFTGMYQTAKQLSSPVFIVHALQKMGVELKRAGRHQEAIDCRPDRAPAFLFAFLSAILQWDQEQVARGAQRTQDSCSCSQRTSVATLRSAGRTRISLKPGLTDTKSRRSHLAASF